MWTGNVNMTSLHYTARDHRLQIPCPRESSSVITTATQTLSTETSDIATPAYPKPFSRYLIKRWSKCTMPTSHSSMTMT